MSNTRPPVQRLALWPWLAAGAGACVLAAGFATVELRGKHVQPAAAAPPHSGPLAAMPNPPSAAAAVAPQAAADAPPKPSFDVVRVDNAGDAVIAGRAAPGADVTIRDGGAELGRVKADDSGQWAFVPRTALNAGSRELTLSERMPSGSELRADASVLLVVPDRKQEPAAANPTPAMAVLAPEKPAAEAAARVLQPPPPVGLGPGARLGLDLLQYDAQGSVVFSGSAPPGAPVRLYVDNRRIGDASTDPSGRWSLTPSGDIDAGRHRVRVDQLNTSGRVSARVELPFARETEPEKAVGQGRVVVQPGENLWRLARHVYGSGVRYVVIYRANREQIRDPKLIYPGQAFATPDAQPDQPPATAAPAPAAAAKPSTG
ncbi:MAG: LysM peptidoglycan-binding domain-containing protein [Alphaproteobacteria bacterium]|nr:LysM peptidoglycan-binding domain-containing protein [Alphaproteobacteria bacterium]